MRESQYIAAIHKKLPQEIYAWKIADRFRGGVADAWYSAKKDLWIEYKYEQKPFGKKYTPNISKLQEQWLTARKLQGRNVAIIMGSSSGAFVRQNQTHWKKQYSVPEKLLSKKEIADWIAEQITDNDPITRT